MKYIPSDASRSAFGDLFGAVNALFSGLAFLGLIVAIILQRKELEEQRKEIRQSRIAQAESAEALQLQSQISGLNARVEAINHIMDGLDRRIKHAESSDRFNSDEIVRELREEQEKYNNDLKTLLSELNQIEKPSVDQTQYRK